MLPITFSERNGFVAVRQVMQTHSLDEATASRLWNSVFPFLPNSGGALDHELYRSLWDEHFQLPITQIPHYASELFSWIERNYFTKMVWHSKLDFIQALVDRHPRWKEITERANTVLLQQGCGYHFIEDILVRRLEDEQVAAIENALSPDISSPAKLHIRTALVGLRPGDKNVDTKAVVREAIHAVEAQVKEQTGLSGATLTGALKELEKTRTFHPAFLEAIKKLYSYTSDESGIRHAHKELQADVTEADALFMVVACSAFVTWLASHPTP